MMDAEILLLGERDEELSHSVFAVCGYIILMFILGCSVGLLLLGYTDVLCHDVYTFVRHVNP
jgi:hypothetical protein